MSEQQERWDRQARWANEAVALSQQLPDRGYVARVFTQTSLPYRQPPPDLKVWQRHNGNVTLTLRPDYGPDGTPLYPYGIIPRLLLTWITTEAVRKQSPTLELGDSLAGFMRQLGMTATGGKNGSITRLRDQMKRLTNASFLVTIEGETYTASSQLAVASGHFLFKADQAPEGQPRGRVQLTQEFYNEVTERPIPVDLNALAHLRTVGPMALDVYSWLTYRMSYLRSRSTISWAQIRAQFGSQSADNSSSRHKFALDFDRAMRHVLTVYPDARAEATSVGVVLRPGRTHVAKIAPKAHSTLALPQVKALGA